MLKFRLLTILLLLLCWHASVGQSIVYIDQLDLSNAEQDDYPIGNCKNVKGNPIQLNHIKYDRGLGTFTNSMLHINLNKGASKFMAMVGFDDEVLGQGCHPIEFIVYADDQIVWRSGAMKPTDAPKPIDVNLKGKSILTLYVKSVRGKWNGFSAWADAKLEVSGQKPEAFERKKETPYILTPLVSAMAQINGPGKVGVHPGAPFQYYIPVSGTRPISYEIENLPDGLSLDPATGIISGQIVKRGTYKLLLKVKNKEGSSKKEFIIEVGDTLALTPPMGWNSWNVWAVNVSQEKLLAAANVIKTSGLINYGWTYVNIDDGWQDSIRGGKWNAILPNRKFPDMKGLCDYIHRLGLKTGIYSTPWDRTYAQFIGSSSDCEDGTSPYYSKNTYRIEFGFYPFYKQDAKQWAEWGFDYLKLDWFPNSVSHTIEFRKALEETGRDFVYSLSNAAPIEQVTYWQQYSNLWRTTGDIVDSWGSIYAIATEQQEKWGAFGGPGHWNDPDMLVLGWLGWGKDLHYTRLTPTEQYSHISLWAFMSAPLLIGADLSQLEPFTFNLLSNSEVIDIDQDILGGNVKQIKIDDLIEVWVKDLSDGSKAVGLCNFGILPHTIILNWADLGIDGNYTVRDVWRQKNIGTYSDSFESEVLPHGVKLLKLIKKQ